MPLRVLALIPARAGSKRVPGKNARLLGGKPLVQWTLDNALAARAVGRVLVSTDDPQIAAIARARAAHVLDRPAGLAGDHASSVDVALHALDYERDAGRDWDVLCLLQPTSPFRAAGRIDAGIEILAKSPEACAVVGAVRPHHHPLHCLMETEDGGLARIGNAHQLAAAARSQDMPPAWALTGSFYAVRTNALRTARSFLPPATLPIACDAPGEDIDIDWPADFDRAEAYIQSAKVPAG